MLFCMYDLIFRFIMQKVNGQQPLCQKSDVTVLIDVTLFSAFFLAVCKDREQPCAVSIQDLFSGDQHIITIIKLSAL